ncbi:unnamed protein product, partial [marine sediment metagenome]
MDIPSNNTRSQGPLTDIDFKKYGKDCTKLDCIVKQDDYKKYPGLNKLFQIYDENYSNDNNWKVLSRKLSNKKEKDVIMDDVLLDSDDDYDDNW